MNPARSSHPGCHGSLHVSLTQRRRDVVHGEGDPVEDPLWGGGGQEEDRVSGESEQEERRAGFRQKPHGSSSVGLKPKFVHLRQLNSG